MFFRIGEYCVLHGNNCIGENLNKEDAPEAGNHLDLGIGSNLIGDIKLGDNIIVGASAVVINDYEDNAVVAGVPAKLIKRN